MRVVRFRLLAFILLIPAVHGTDQQLPKRTKIETNEQISQYIFGGLASSDGSSRPKSPNNEYVNPRPDPIDSFFDVDGKNDPGPGQSPYSSSVSDVKDVPHQKTQLSEIWNVERSDLLNHGGPYSVMQDANYKPMNVEGLKLNADHLIPFGIFEDAGVGANPYPGEVNKLKALHGTLTITEDDHHKLVLTCIPGPKEGTEPTSLRVKLKDDMTKLAKEGNTRDLLLFAVAQYQFAPADPPYNNLLQKYAHGLIQAIDQNVRIGLISADDAIQVKEFYKLEEYQKNSLNVGEADHTKVDGKVKEMIDKHTKTKKNKIIYEAIAESPPASHNPDRTVNTVMQEEILPRFQKMANEKDSPKPIVLPEKDFIQDDGMMRIPEEQQNRIDPSTSTSGGCRSKRSIGASACILLKDLDDGSATNDKIRDGPDTESDRTKHKQIAEDLGPTKLLEHLKDLPEGERQSFVKSIEEIGVERIRADPDTVSKLQALVQDQESLKLMEMLEKVQTGQDIFADGVGSSRIVASPDILAESALSRQSIVDQEGAKGNSGGSKFDKSLGRVSMVLLGKNLIKSVLDGDDKGTGIMLGLVGGDMILNEVGERATKLGQKYSEKAKTLTKYGKRGAALKVAGPILGSLSTIFSVYQLTNSVSALKAVKASCNRTTLFQKSFDRECELDKDLAIISVVENSLDVGLGVAALGATLAIAFSVAAAAPIASILTAVGIAVSLASLIASAVLEVDKINNVIQLSTSETWATGWRTFLGQGPPDYIQRLVEKKAAWEGLVETQVNFLEHNSDYQVKVDPSLRPTCTTIRDGPGKDANVCVLGCFATLGIGCLFKSYRKHVYCEAWEERCTYTDFYEDSEVDFRNKVHLTWDRSVPGEISKGNYLCKPEGSNGGASMYDYKCKNAMAVSFPERKGKPALFELRNGTDIAWGLPSDPNVFLVEQGRKRYTGGGGDDTFILISGPATGVLDGGAGMNTLIINESYVPTGVARLNLESHPADNLHIMNVHNVRGRYQLPDNVTVDCSTKEVDLRGGSSLQEDIIDIPYSTCSYNLKLQLHAFTVVDNRAEQGLFFYAIPTKHRISVNIHTSSANCKHRFVFFDPKLKFTKEFSQLEVSSLEFLVLSTAYIHDMELFVSNGIQIFLIEGEDEFAGKAEISSREEFHGLWYHRNIILVKAGTIINGGSRSDVFVLSGGEGGNLDAGEGLDSLRISAEYHNKEKLLIDFLSGKVALAVEPENELWSLRNFENIMGRNSCPDRILLSCSVREVLGMGGQELDYDEIIFPRTGCRKYENENSPFVVAVDRYTKIENLSPKGNFLYQIQSLDSIIEVGTGSNAFHTYLFSTQHSTNVKEIELDEKKENLKLTFEDGGRFSQRINASHTVLLTSDLLEIAIVPEIWGLVTLKDNSQHAGTVGGLRFHRNRFSISTTRNYDIEGGNDDDVFVLDGNSFQGSIHGREGNNALVLEETFAPGRKLYFDMTEGVFSEWGNASNPMIDVTDIHVFVGRSNYSDYVHVNCSTTSVDTKGAPLRNQTEMVYIPTSNCTYNMTIMLNPNEIVVNEAWDGKFTYIGDFANGTTKLSMNFKAGSIIHEILFDFDYVELEGIQKWDDDFVLLTKRDGGKFQTNYWVEDELDLHSGPRIKFKDGIELKIGAFGEPGTSGFGKLSNPPGTTAPSRGKRAVSEQWTAPYIAAAKRTKTDLILQYGPSTLYSVGGGSELDILTAVPDFTNYLIGNQAEETIFRIEDGTGPVFINPGSNASFLLDVSPVGILKPSTWRPEVRRRNQDILLEFSNHSITIEGGVQPDSEILLRNVRLRISCSEQNETCSLVAPPMKIDPEDTKMVFLTKRDFEDGSVVQIANESDLDLRPSRHGNNLVLTNLFRNDSLQERTLSVIILDYFDIAAELSEKGVDVQVGYIPVLSPLEDNLTSAESIPVFEDEAEVFHRESLKMALDIEEAIVPTQSLPIEPLPTHQTPQVTTTLATTTPTISIIAPPDHINLHRLHHNLHLLHHNSHLHHHNSHLRHHNPHHLHHNLHRAHLNPHHPHLNLRHVHHNLHHLHHNTRHLHQSPRM